MIIRLEDTKRAEALFDGWQETLIWSCLQGIMGAVYVTALDEPLSAMAAFGDFCFLAGKPDRELVQYWPPECTSDCLLMTPQNEEWAQLIEECHGSNAYRTLRYAIKKEPDGFNRDYLKRIVRALPEMYTICPVDEGLYEICRQQE